MVTETAEMTTLFVDRDMSAGELCELAAGQAVVYTHACPDGQKPNEDAAAVITIDPESGVLAVADGMGGQPSGGRASSVALAALDEAVQQTLADSHELRDVILNGFEAANQAVSGLGVGAGTTLAVVQVQEHWIRPYHVGDSMILVVGQRGKIKLQTVSHSPVGYAVEAGLLDDREALHHEDRHLVSNMVGAPDMRIEIGAVLELAARDTVLVASDGLFDNLHTDEIVGMVRAGPLPAVAERLARACHERMLHPGAEHPSKPDDLTFIAYRHG